MSRRTSTSQANPGIVAATRCGACQAVDDHPKHEIAVGFNNDHTGGEMFHEHDMTREGVIYYHFDCPTPWHDLSSNLATTARPAWSEDEPWTAWLEESAAEHREVAQAHAEIVAKCKSGLRGAELKSWIQRMHVRGGAGGVDQPMATAILDALAPNSGTTTVGAKTITGPLHLRVMTANGTDAAAGTEQATSAGYTAGGAAIAFAAAAAGTKATNAAVSWVNFPACTTTGPEEWDTSATPQRTFWGPWTGGSIVIGAGNTFTVASGSLSNSLA